MVTIKYHRPQIDCASSRHALCVAGDGRLFLPGMEELAADAGPQTPVGHVQVDSFCAHCHYNLFSQVVSRDQRLGILVCRCPECGRFSAAGNMTTASQKFTQRLATGALVLYIGFLLAVVIASGALFWASQASYLDDTFNDRHAVNAEMQNPVWVELAGGAIVGAALGGFFATFCWHWRRGVRYLATMLPLLIVPIAWNAWRAFAYTPVTKPRFADWGWTVLATVAGIQMVSILAGEILGRPIARIALQVLLPVRLLPYLSFLWSVDGRSVPVPRTVGASPVQPV